MILESLTTAPPETNRLLLSHFNHTMRTPLNTICGLCDLLRSEAGFSVEQYHHLEAIYNDGLRMLSYIEALTELLSASVPAPVRPVPLSELTNRIVQITGSPLQLPSAAATANPSIPCAPETLRHTLQHLWSHIAWGANTPHVEIVLRNHGTDWVVCIRDYNHPVPPELSALAFLPFGLATPACPDRYAPLELTLARHWARRGAMQLQLTETNPNYTDYELKFPAQGCPDAQSR